MPLGSATVTKSPYPTPWCWYVRASRLARDSSSARVTVCSPQVTIGRPGSVWARSVRICPSATALATSEPLHEARCNDHAVDLHVVTVRELVQGERVPHRVGSALRVLRGVDRLLGELQRERRLLGDPFGQF